MLSNGPAAAACPARWPIAAPATSPRLRLLGRDATRAAEVLGWRTQRDLDAMCRDLVLATGQLRRLRRLNSDVIPDGAQRRAGTSSRTARRAEPVRHPGRPAGPSRDPDGHPAGPLDPRLRGDDSKKAMPSPTTAR